MIAEMIVEMMRSRTRLLVGGLAVAGVLFVLYPIIRPFSDEASFQGAAAFASTAWVESGVPFAAGFALYIPQFFGTYGSRVLRNRHVLQRDRIVERVVELV